jgi:2-polyprenyl-3-methyl-5-hydroxy-6-metoxy-1,4-benzoquinol methylase
MRLFMEVMQPAAETTVIDVGVGDTGFLTEAGVAATHNFFEAMYPWPAQITAVSEVPLPHFAEAFPAIRHVTADGRALPFDDDSFDVAFSNAVVEHVGGIEDQRRFVHELCRVAPNVFVSTPNRWFPVETHTLLPLVHWLPRGPRDRVLRALGQRRWIDLNLLSRKDLLQLFPGNVAVQILESRITITAAASRRAA